MKKWNNEENINRSSNYNTIVSRLSVKVKLWKSFSAILLLIIFFELAIIGYIGSRPRPGYIVEVSSSTGQVYLNPENVKDAATYVPNEDIKRQMLSNFIVNLRSVSTDRTVTAQRLLSVYSMMDQRAADQVRSYVEETNPVKRGETERVNAEVFNISRLGDNTYQIDWRETVTSASSGVLISDKRYRAVVQTAIYRPRNDEQRENNPLGFFITDISISTIKEV